MLRTRHKPFRYFNLLKGLCVFLVLILFTSNAIAKIQIESELYLRDIALLIAGLVAILVLIIIYIHNSGLHFNWTKKGRSELAALTTMHEGHSVAENSSYSEWTNQMSFPIFPSEYHTVWEINLFSTYMHNHEESFACHEGLQWYEFSKSQSSSERIMAPIFRKIFSKYRKKFEKKTPIYVLYVPKETQYLYTWLRNESHAYAAIFSFLEETNFISNEAGVIPSLSIIWDDVIYFEVSLPKQGFGLQFEKLLSDLSNHAVDVTFEELRVSIKLWIAFTIEKVPACLRYETRNNQKKAS